MQKLFHQLFLVLMLALMFAVPALAEIGDLFIDFDGTQLSVSFVAEPETLPAFLVLDELTLGGVSILPNDDDFSGTWVGYPEGEASSKTCAFSVALDDIRLTSEGDSAAWATVMENAQNESIEAFFNVSICMPKAEVSDPDAFIASFEDAQALVNDENMEVLRYSFQLPLAAVETPNDGTCPLVGLPEEDTQNP